MLFSLCLILILSLAMGVLCRLCHLPALLGYMLVGIFLQAFSLIDSSILAISSQLRQIALIIILIRSGLSLNLQALKRVGRPALLLCFVPASFEIVAVGLIAPLIFGFSYSESFLLGSILGAVSPAVVAPRMISMIEEGRGQDHAVPQMLLAGASADDVYCVVLFTAFCSLATGQALSAMTFLKVPLSVGLGVGSGILIGIVFFFLFSKVHMRDTVKVMILLGVAFGLVALENYLKTIDTFWSYSGLLAVVTMAIVLCNKLPIVAKRLSCKYNKIWLTAEVVLFVLVGASVSLKAFVSQFFLALLLIVCGLIARMIAVLLCTIKTPLTKKERLFSAIAYTPKATVQAALVGSIPVALALGVQETIVAVAVVSILITAPLGAFSIDCLKNKVFPLKQEKCE